MIGSLSGTVAHLSSPFAVIQTSGGVGYEIELPLPSWLNLNLGEAVTLWTHLVVREDAQLLYGFSDLESRDLFRVLIRINGIGAKVAAAILSHLSPSELAQAVMSEQLTQLTRVPGIGKKTAERILIELRDKLGAFSSGASADLLSAPSQLEEAKSALIGLGYSEKEAQAALKGADSSLPTAVLIRSALKSLSR